MQSSWSSAGGSTSPVVADDGPRGASQDSPLTADKSGKDSDALIKSNWLISKYLCDRGKKIKCNNILSTAVTFYLKFKQCHQTWGKLIFMEVIEMKQ